MDLQVKDGHGSCGSKIHRSAINMDMSGVARAQRVVMLFASTRMDGEYI